MDWRRPLLHCAVFVTLSLAAPLALAGPGQHAVASAHPAATEAGEAVLRDGGNAFDAAVAITAALGVAEPYGSGLGGGGFFLLYEASSERSVMPDARETAPAAADRDMYLDADGEVIDGLSLDGVLGAGIPGMPAGMDHLAREYGRLSLADSLAPAIRLAEDGVPVSGRYLQMAGFRHQALRDGADARDIYLEAGRLPDEGAILRQPDLAVTLRRLADEGRDGFYTGDLAERLATHGVQVLEQARIPWRVVYSSPSFGGIRAGVLAGLGVTVLAESVVPEGLQTLAPGARLPELPAVRVELHYNRHWATEAVRGLAEYMAANLAERHGMSRRTLPAG